MNPEHIKLLREEADLWIEDNQSSIEVYDSYLPFEFIPEEYKDDPSALEMDAFVGKGPDPFIDHSIGFCILPVSIENGPSGYACIEVHGNNFDMSGFMGESGLDISVKGIFSSENELRQAVAKRGYIKEY